ncbi:MAG: alpha/beta hydrolase [Gammaproteobacteria bacterium]|nr:alpha/beta hydrolase [Gammaproteobacteria bacterium]
MKRYMQLGWIVGLVSCWMVAFAAESPWLFNVHDVNALHRSEPLVRLAYDAHSQAFGYLRLPKGPGPFPVVMLIHGGCWLAALKVDAQNTEPLSDALTSLGVATWNIEYRQLGQEGAGFPGTFLDVAHAADYLQHIAEKYHLDLTRVMVMGHSAGGQLALWLAARDKLPLTSPLYRPHPLKLKAAVSLGGVVDLKVTRLAAEKICGADVIGGLLGVNHGNITDARYAETSPMEMLPIAVPQILISGDADRVVPTQLSEWYMKRAKATADDATLVVVPFAGHHEYIAPNSVVWPVLNELVKRYIKLDQLPLPNGRGSD